MPDRTGITAFINARLDERERLLRIGGGHRFGDTHWKALETRAVLGGWAVSRTSGVSVDLNDRITLAGLAFMRELFDGWQRADDAWELADIAAKRALAARHAPEGVADCPDPDCDIHRPDGKPPTCIVRAAAYPLDAVWPCVELRLLAGLDCGHPDYDPAWRVDA